MSADDRTRLTVLVHGLVQGVGFRWSVRERAAAIGGLTGYARNLADGGVEVLADGGRAECTRLLEWLRSGDTPGRVGTVAEQWDDSPATGPAHQGFTIR
ncbi:acylphosphatase [Kitasatospora sp. NPDC096147]|uniref:acylphosphatase n=1 Tax=Kitasatospora sp. NPDC096147 TaxID=3364093 RepID=UPI00380C57D4